MTSSFREVSVRHMLNGDTERTVEITVGNTQTVYTVYKNKNFVLAEVYEVFDKRKPHFYQVHAFRDGETCPVLAYIEKMEIKSCIGPTQQEKSTSNRL